jgi:hypothetical protein
LALTIRTPATKGRRAKRTIAIDMKEMPDIPAPVKIVIRVQPARPSATVAR